MAEETATRRKPKHRYGRKQRDGSLPIRARGNSTVTASINCPTVARRRIGRAAATNQAT